MLITALSIAIIVLAVLLVLSIYIASRAVREEKQATKQLEEQKQLSNELSIMYRDERAKHNITKLCLKAFYGVEK